VTSACHLKPNFCRLYIFGAGGHGRELAWLAHQAWGDAVEVQFVVDRPEFLGDPVNNFAISLLHDVDAGLDTRFVVALGDSAARRAATASCVSAGHVPATLVHPRVELSNHVELGDGVVLCAGVIVTTNIKIGKHVHVNIGCTISHDVRIGDYSTLSPGVHIAGNVVIGEDVFIGTGASVINGRLGEPLTIDDGAVIAAGACVTEPVGPRWMVAGVPAVRKR
jgi:sugar O-acyltransferase (sialic acid O-acetyltransferase NeuD family)